MMGILRWKTQLNSQHRNRHHILFLPQTILLLEFSLYYNDFFIIFLFYLTSIMKSNKIGTFHLTKTALISRYIPGALNGVIVCNCKFLVSLLPLELLAYTVAVKFLSSSISGRWKWPAELEMLWISVPSGFNSSR